MLGVINKKLVELEIITCLRDNSQQVFWRCFKNFGDQDRVLQLSERLIAEKP